MPIPVNSEILKNSGYQENCKRLILDLPSALCFRNIFPHFFCNFLPDNEAPAFAGCPSDETIILRASESFQSVSWIPPTVSDNVMVASNTSSATPGSNFYFGMAVVTYYANDTAGNEMQCQFTIDVQGGMSFFFFL